MPPFNFHPFIRILAKSHWPCLTEVLPSINITQTSAKRNFFTRVKGFFGIFSKISILEKMYFFRRFANIIPNNFIEIIFVQP